MRTALTLEAKEDARRFFDQERVKLLQEIAELKNSKKQTDEALSNMIQSDKMKAGDLRVEHQQHQEQISKIKWDSERDIRRLVGRVTTDKLHMIAVCRVLIKIIVRPGVGYLHSTLTCYSILSLCFCIKTKF